ncbi:MAG: endoribonuclease MazF [Melioribacteraceae bacterium]|nr:endoribonuclease MazF [Melioribacteraceae bacterium]MCF8395312.1 endoribonuclease MazF [Melioribacteraceae bacterium]MCF8420334.1 endoribonuclease MazF [Melioribacteraceae bacterium]
MVKTKVPDKGDIVWLSFNPQTGHEQSGRRPALVISPQEYNGKTNLAIFCPISSQVKEYPFEVKIPDNLEISGVILSDQVKSLDWKTRKAEFICKLPKAVLTDTLNKINALINP